ncbi:hypothetical protein B0H19DRAFT_1240951 [Mycena capillaripes]|nr:hypothetical protein B0H19DRAFT_1240951 [Mycena capillaripes]
MEFSWVRNMGTPKWPVSKRKRRCRVIGSGVPAEDSGSPSSIRLFGAVRYKEIRGGNADGSQHENNRDEDRGAHHDAVRRRAPNPRSFPPGSFSHHPRRRIPSTTVKDPTKETCLWECKKFYGRALLSEKDFWLKKKYNGCSGIQTGDLGPDHRAPLFERFAMLFQIWQTIMVKLWSIWQ